MTGRGENQYGKRDQFKERNARIVELAKTMGAAQITRALLADYPDINRNKVIAVIHRQCPKDDRAKRRRQAEGTRMNRVAKERSGHVRGNLGTAAPTTEQRARADLPPKHKPVPPKPISDPAMRPSPWMGRTAALEIPVEGSTPVPYAERTGCVWPFGERSTMMACNLPKCTVKAGGVPYQVDYCAGHWDARRTTKHTQIVG